MFNSSSQKQNEHELKVIPRNLRDLLFMKIQNSELLKNTC